MSNAATLLREARTRAGLSQRALARRAGTAQSVIARIEKGQTSPTWETLERLLDAAGVDMSAQLEPRVVVGSHMLDDVPRILALTPEVVLLGTGATQRFAPPAVRAALAQRGVGLEAMQLGAACRTFNVLVQEERRVAAALFLR